MDQPLPAACHVALVAAGSAAGALLRAALTQLVPGPWPVLWVLDVGGALLLGLLTGWSCGRRRGRWLVPLLGPGVLGGLTTFSAVTVLAAGSPGPGPLAAVLGMTVAGVLAAWAGLLLAGTGSRSRAGGPDGPGEAP
ncbi:CrcB family protein [Auraticoccus cholistanensis]|uniref:CrcB family protein n=1 Tax=Auraticoccus cholistanensis TaxID=2656650 RepID=UPI0018D229F1